MMNRIDVVVIHPGAVHGIYGELGNDLVAVEPPLFCRLIAGYVRDQGHSVRIIDAEAERLGAEDVARRVADYAPRFVCITVFGHQPSASTQQMVGAGATVRAVRRLCKTQIVMTGGHVSALPERTLREEDIDFAIKGEGPLTLGWLLDGFLSHGSIPGLVWRDGSNNIRVNEAAPLISNLDIIHGDVWDLLPMERYTAHNWHCFDDIHARRPYASIYTSLGCPYSCSFCCINSPFGKPSYRMRSAESVVNEIAMLRETYGIRNIKITDELFVLNQRHVRGICEGIVERGLDDLNIWAYARTDTVNAEMLPLMRKAGIRWLALGIESGDAAIRDGVDKNLKAGRDIRETVAAIRAAGIYVIGNYIFGLPNDTPETMRATLDLAKELNTEFANFYSAIAYPGSRLYDEAVEKGWALPTTWDGYSQHAYNSTPLPTEHLTSAEILAFRDEAFNEYFENEEYRLMVFVKFGAEALEHVKSMTRYRLKRRLLEKELVDAAE